jgi:hypothetical protein
MCIDPDYVTQHQQLSAEIERQESAALVRNRMKYFNIPPPPEANAITALCDNLSYVIINPESSLLLEEGDIVYIITQASNPPTWSSLATSPRFSLWLVRSKRVVCCNLFQFSFTVTLCTIFVVFEIAQPSQTLKTIWFTIIPGTLDAIETVRKEMTNIISDPPSIGGCLCKHQLYSCIITHSVVDLNSSKYQLIEAFCLSFSSSRPHFFCPLDCRSLRSPPVISVTCCLIQPSATSEGHNERTSRGTVERTSVSHSAWLLANNTFKCLSNRSNQICATFFSLSHSCSHIQRQISLILSSFKCRLLYKFKFRDLGQFKRLRTRFELDSIVFTATNFFLVHYFVRLPFECQKVSFKAHHPNGSLVDSSLLLLVSNNIRRLVIMSSCHLRRVQSIKGRSPLFSSTLSLWFVLLTFHLRNRPATTAHFGRPLCQQTSSRSSSSLFTFTPHTLLVGTHDLFGRLSPTKSAFHSDHLGPMIIVHNSTADSQSADLGLVARPLPIIVITYLKLNFARFVRHAPRFICSLSTH